MVVLVVGVVLALLVLSVEAFQLQVLPAVAVLCFAVGYFVVQCFVLSCFVVHYFVAQTLQECFCSKVRKVAKVKFQQVIVCDYLLDN